MEHIDNAKDEKISRGREKRLPQTQREGLESVRCSSESNEPQQVSISNPDSTGEDSAWKLTPIRDTTAGKILERLEALETQHLKYVHAHQNRLKARLGESEQAEEEFLKEANQIKSDIYYLAIAQQKADGNGHIN